MKKKINTKEEQSTSGRVDWGKTIIQDNVFTFKWQLLSSWVRKVREVREKEEAKQTVLGEVLSD